MKAGDLETETGVRVINRTCTSHDDRQGEPRVRGPGGPGPRVRPGGAQREVHRGDRHAPRGRDLLAHPEGEVRVENTRVGQRTDYDKLILEIWTDGTITPDDALAESAKIAKDHFTIFINFDEAEAGGDDEIDEDEERIRALLDTPVEELELSVRSSNCLRNANIRTIGDLTQQDRGRDHQDPQLRKEEPPGDPRQAAGPRPRPRHEGLRRA